MQDWLHVETRLSALLTSHVLADRVKLDFLVVRIPLNAMAAGPVFVFIHDKGIGAFRNVAFFRSPVVPQSCESRLEAGLFTNSVT